MKKLLLASLLPGITQAAYHTVMPIVDFIGLSDDGVRTACNGSRLPLIYQGKIPEDAGWTGKWIIRRDKWQGRIMPVLACEYKE
ncbi:hypothetical protein M1466_02055 [Candidatus Dependentiae bacterium]|nr:hypothetical protein [Candidatus Dependentiae bacterium]